LLSLDHMSIQNAARFGQIRLAQRVGRSLPWIGAAIALYTLGAAIRQKGVLGGSVDTALNAIPYVGGVKNAAEMVRGRDFIRDRQRIAGRAS
jgi:hypothetical protein